MRASGRTRVTYAITDGEYLKVGVTSFHPGMLDGKAVSRAIYTRLASLQTGNARLLRPVAARIGNVERQAHAALERVGCLRFVGEWFADRERGREVLEDLGFQFFAEAK
jgi:hypothetical protein